MRGKVSRSASEVSITSDTPALGLTQSHPAEIPLTAKLCLSSTAYENKELPKFHSRIGLATA